MSIPAEPKTEEGAKVEACFVDYYYRLLQWKARVTGLEYHSGENMNSATKHFIRSREHNI